MPDNGDTHRAAPCPVCRRPALQKFRPFCSRRCADIDLNRWLSGVYAIPVNDDTDEDGGQGKHEPL